MMSSAITSLTRRHVLGISAAALAAGPLGAFKSRITKANISAITDEIGLTQTDAIAFAHQYGLQWVELRNVPETKKEVAFLSEPEIKALAAQLASNKLKVSFLNTSLMKFAWPGTDPVKVPVETPEQRTKRLAANQKRWENRKADVETAVRAANILGTDKIRIFAGTRVAKPETVYSLIQRTMEEFIPIVEKGKCRLLIENEYSENIGTSAETRDIMKLLPSKSIGFNWDPGNELYLKAVSYPDGYNLLPKDRMLNAQFKAKNLMEGEEKIDWLSILKAMQNDGYQGQIGLETHTTPVVESAHTAMKTIMHLVGQL
ncbi:MAG: Xylose isomerase domain protein barrel [Bryobacterales bacterium]|nr:Xylose isomerase domain protein barrel [Bryobacterales bacterium]